MGASFTARWLSRFRRGAESSSIRNRKCGECWYCFAAKNHPEGFRYELLVTSLTDHTKTYDLTASLNPSFLDAGEPAHPISKAEKRSAIRERDGNRRFQFAIAPAQLNR